jgi:heterotetrameric sarcosine oxidase alpha subunit
MTQPFRNAEGGLIDRAQLLPFTFDGKACHGYAGDTLASALLANGVRLVGRSFKYHRPRGIVAAGVEDPNALVQLGRGARTEPNIRATQAELFAGLEATSQNRWPSLRLDLGGVAGALAPLFPAGFYYKTFKWPSAWLRYEPFIRRAAGLGRAATAPDPDRYEKIYGFADVLVAGGGPAGLAAALAAGRMGARVVLADDRPALGGSLLWTNGEIEGKPALAWVRAAEAELAAMPEATILRRTTAFAYYDHDMVALAERLTDHLPATSGGRARQRLWRVRAKQVVLATGALERPIPFADNDRPGVMLASAAQTYANQYAVRAGRKAVVFTNNDSAYAAARDLAAAGIEIVAVVDVRPKTSEVPPPGARHLTGHAVVHALGRQAVRAVEVAPLIAAERIGGPVERLACDLVCVSGGWSPTVHLHAQARGRPAYDPVIAAFVPGPAVQHERSAGAARGSFTLVACLTGGFEAGQAAAVAAGIERRDVGPAPATPVAKDPTPIQPCWAVPLADGAKAKRFVDHQNDVTVEDVALAVREGYDHVELLKRYTTLGMGTDQGRTSNVPGLALLAAAQGREIAAVGTTTFRPPFAPVTVGAFAGRAVGPHHPPVRRTAIHSWHEQAGARFVDAGLWKRPALYPGPGEEMWDAIFREVRAVRHTVGMVDVSTLGKIDLQGPDTATFLDRVYINRVDNLRVGRCRYGVMLREDGMVLDDGTIARLAEHHFLITTTTAKAAQVVRHLEFLLQVVWPELEVHLLEVSDSWAQVALAGARSRAVLAEITDVDVCNQAVPFMGMCNCTLAGVRGRAFRISFSGELAYELAVPADYGRHLWEALLEAGQPLGLTPYGTEAMNILRIEKGHVTGGEINGRSSADDLGFGRMLKAGTFFGKRSLRLPAHLDVDRAQLVGLVCVDGMTRVPRGAQIVADPRRASPNPILGEVTSTCWSPNLDKPIALGLLRRGRARHGERLFAASPLQNQIVEVEVTRPVFFDADGERLRG